MLNWNRFSARKETCLQATDHHRHLGCRLDSSHLCRGDPDDRLRPVRRPLAQPHRARLDKVELGRQLLHLRNQVFCKTIDWAIFDNVLGNKFDDKRSPNIFECHSLTSSIYGIRFFAKHLIHFFLL